MSWLRAIARALLAGPRGHHEPPAYTGPPPTRPPAKPEALVRCPTCGHRRDDHGPFGCTGVFCSCERSYVGGGWP